MKRHLFIIKARAFALLAAIAALVGCIRDSVDNTRTLPADGSVSLSIAMQSPVQKSIGGTRAGATDFDILKDINIVIAEGSDDEHETLLTIFLDFDDQSGELTGALPGGIEYARHDAAHSIHFSREWLSYYEIPATTAVFFIVGNYGSKIDVATVGALRDLRDDSPDNPGSVGSRHIMFGESVDLGPGDPSHIAHISQSGHENGRTLTVSPARTAAMLTVKINGEGLNSNVVITPLSVSLHNVPAWCLLGRDNVITTEPGGITPLPGAVVANGESYTAADLGWGMIASSSSGVNNTSPVVGAHYTDAGAGGTETAPNYDHEPLRPLFLFENLHGGDSFGALNTEPGQQTKRPAAAPGTSEAAINSVAGACSYLEIRARYRTLNPDLTVASGGEVTYRVFLGGDVWQNFDVVRNTYYRLTLVLNATAIGEGNASWRLEHNVTNQSALSESDFVLNGAGEMIVINELIPQGDASHMGVHFVDGDDQQRANNGQYMYLVKEGDGWLAIPLTGGEWNGKLGTRAEGGDNMQFRLLLSPMAHDGGYGDTRGYMRRVTFYFTPRSGNYRSENITITQYAPVRIEVAADDSRLTPEIIALIAAAGKSLPLTILLDRVDRDALPWGFYGLSVVNSNSGYENGRNLMAISGMADDYLPFGKPLFAGDAGQSSAMMHAAFINYYQQAVSSLGGFAESGVLPPAPVTIGQVAAAPDPVNPVVPNSIPTRAEWQLLEMLENAGFEVFDHRHEPLPWINYWTSDAVEDNDTRSWAYRVGVPNGPGIVEVDRTSSVRYRMVRFY